MFKYKSPLSRLLEGAGKTKEAENSEAEAPAAAAEDQPQPIADFNALREVLGGGSLNSDAYEDTEELIPEDRMPEFEENEEKADADPAPETRAEMPEPDADADQQIVTLHVAPAETEVSSEDLMASVTGSITQASEVPETAQETLAEEKPMADEPVAPDTPAPDTAALETAPESVPVAAEAPAADRRARVKTTFLGFERPDTHVQELIETAEPIRKAEAAAETFPVGWLVITGGPGRGASITLKEGLMQIGRNDDQAIQLDFGDTGISRSNHAVIAYDPEDRKCYLGHGGKANLVRLNGKPVLSTVPLTSGDLIRISETSIRFVAFCDENFDWRDA